MCDMSHVCNDVTCHTYVMMRHVCEDVTCDTCDVTCHVTWI
jgi:hypothetical protein